MTSFNTLLSAQSKWHFYNETARWSCLNRHSGHRHFIHGPLSQILKQYPHDYQLRFLGFDAADLSENLMTIAS